MASTAVRPDYLDSTPRSPEHLLSVLIICASGIGAVQQLAGDIGVIDISRVDVLKFQDTAFAAAVARVSHSSLISVRDFVFQKGYPTQQVLILILFAT